MRLSCTLACCAVLLFSLIGVKGQEGQIFEWGFTGSQGDSTSLPSCRNLRLTADALTAPGVPPFYMMAFAVGGAPIMTFIGENQSNLTWTARHPIGTQLLLGVVDSQGTSGGIDPVMYTVTAGATTQCGPQSAADPPFTVTANVTDVLTTCQPWGLTIQGGTPPYNVTFAALNAPDVTNATLGPDDSIYTYINRAVPGTQMITAVSDVNGRWATGSPLVRTQGPANVDCVGLQSSGSAAVPISQPQNGTPTARSPPISRAKIGIIAGAAVIALLLICALGTWAVRRRRRFRRARERIMVVAPFNDHWEGEARVHPGSVPQIITHKSSNNMSLTSTSSDSRLSPNVGPSTPTTPGGSPLLFGRELPPPYAYSRVPKSVV
ncbi:hypothetical protein DFH06DRAFT_1405965 [Mycena polygramma]|nr:hypothetical protein DFH06DRAFT_1405965 [Mycena polygramma]